MLEKTFDAAAVEPRIAEIWERAGAFKAGAGAEVGAETFTIVIPPPNVTGSLHMGHALNNTLQDILVRVERMRGKDVLWQPGTDHAGIATQMVVERQMMERQEPGRREIGREAFLETIWAWKAESGGTIVNQLKRLGASCDWSRERFTMDEGLSRAVRKVFVDLHKKGLIYRDKRLVNWDPKLLTAISDLEVVQVETKGHLWHFRYPIEGETFDPEYPATFITVATTRPETMLGDTAVAVHPDDERYTHLVGRHVILPLVGRRIPIVADAYSDPEKGSGAVKITPAHDFNDFEVGRRHGLPMINVMNAEGAIDIAENSAFLDTLPANDELVETMTLMHGQDRFMARKRVVAQMDARGFLAKIEPHAHTVPHGDRSGVPIEPYLTDQWYVDAATLASPAIASVREGRTTFVPKNWENTYYQWMENIQPWCVSRQLWWGHQIPAWYGPEHPDRYGAAPILNGQLPREIFVAESEEDVLKKAKEFYPNDIEVEIAKDEKEFQDWRKKYVHGGREKIVLQRDPDVLDTWFSSALWPFSTLGWPDETPELRRYYPTSVLVTGFDIIFFWVARMMMMGLEFMGTEPFKDVYIHALVRDEKGAKMSKSKGNVIDPLELVDEFGADALRFTLAAMAAQGRDIKLAPARVAGYRNFATKLWNAARFAEMNGCVSVGDFEPQTSKETINRWIVSSLNDTIAQLNFALAGYRFNDAANVVYRFVWNQYCDWYLEFAKPILQGTDSEARAETRATAAYILDEILKILHPFMPFITEELWRSTAAEAGIVRPNVLALTRWPTDGFVDQEAFEEINWLVDLVTEIRSVRVEMNVPVASQIPLAIAAAGALTRARVETHRAAIERLARISAIDLVDNAPPASAQIVVGETVACLPLEGVIDVSAERARLGKELKKLDDEVGRIDAKLGNAQFVAKAPEEVIEENRDKREEYLTRRVKVAEALERLTVRA